MPIPFHEADGTEALGEAGFLKIDHSPAGTHYAGGLLLINALGEPIEFTYSRIDVPYETLWRQSDARRFAARRLAVSLLSLCAKVPIVLLCLDDEVERDLFASEVQLSIPVCIVTPAAEDGPPAGISGLDPSETTRAAGLFWISAPPAEASRAAQLMRELALRSLVLEPFERATRGLREVYTPVAGVETK